MNVAISVINTSEEAVFVSFLVRDSSGDFYKPPESDSSITVYPGEAGSHVLQTDKFPVGADDLELVVSGFLYPSLTIPLEQCTHP